MDQLEKRTLGRSGVPLRAGRHPWRCTSRRPEANTDNGFKESLAIARRTLAALRDDRLARALDEALTEKDRKAHRTYEDFQIKWEKEPAEAEKSLGKAIALWEEVLPQATNLEYRKLTTNCLETAHRMHGILLSQMNKPREAETAFQKAIDYGEKELAQEPDRPLIKHHLDESRQRLETLREQAIIDEINKLWNDKRFADALEIARQSVREQEKRVDSDKDREAAKRRLAYRLNRVAGLLARVSRPGSSRHESGCQSGAAGDAVARRCGRILVHFGKGSIPRRAMAR